MINIKIRRLNENDLFCGFLTSLDSLKNASNLKPEKVNEIFKKIESSENQIVFVAVVDSKVVGTATLLLEQKFIHNGTNVGHIEDVAIHKNYQNQGIGKKLIKKILEFSANQDCYKTVLDCNDDVLPFYEKIGFKPHLKGMRFDHER